MNAIVPKVLKSYGTDGAVVTDLCPQDRDIKLTEPVFIRFDGLPVPFFIESIQPKGGRSIVKFEDVDSLSDAEEIVGREILLQLSDDADDDDDITGMKVLDQDGRTVGTITEVLDYGSNICIEVLTAEGHRVLLPFHEDLIIKANRSGIKLHIPEGLV